MSSILNKILFKKKEDKKEMKKILKENNSKEIFKKTKEEILKENNSKENFSKIIDLILLEYSKDLLFNKEHIRLINIAYTILINNIDTDDWYFKKYLEIFFVYNENEIFVRYDPFLCYYKIPYELFKIKCLLRTYKLSEIVKLLLNKTQILPKYTNDVQQYFKINHKLLDNRFGLYFLLKYLIIDIKIPKKFELCTTAIEQMLYVIEYESIFYIPFLFVS